MTKKVLKKGPKRPPSPAKTEVLYEKNCLFLLKKTSQPHKKLNFCMKNDKKVPKKGTQKSTQPPKKAKVLYEKNCIFLPKKTSQLRKKLNFCMKK